MSAFKAARVDPVQIDSLVSDPELNDAESRIEAAIATRASQASVNSLGSTLGPAIANATADKATSAALSAAVDTLAAATAAARDHAEAAGNANTNAVLNQQSAATATLQVSIANAVAPKATSAEVTAAKTAIIDGLAPKATTANVSDAQTALVAAIAPKATSTNVSDAQTALASAIAPKATSAEIATMQTAITTLLSSKSTSGDLSTAQAALTAQATTNQSAVLAAIAAARDHVEAAEAANQTALLSAIAAAGAQVGGVYSFLATQIPANYSRISNLDYVPSGGVVETPSASTSGAGFGDAAYVSSGANTGLWRYKVDRFQRFDVSTNQSVGSAYLCPTTTSSTSGVAVGLAVIGSKIYYAGVVSGSAPTATAKLYCFDTNTLTHSTCADFPRALISTGCVRGIVFGGTKILFTATSAVGLTITQSATPFWIYDTVANTTPVEVIVNLPITKFFGQTQDIVMGMLPSGKIQICDNYAPTSGNLLSCNLVISGNTITPSAAEDTGMPSMTPTYGVYLETATGTLLSYNSSPVRVYVEASGWSAGSAPNAYGSLLYGLRSRKVPGMGWLLVGGPVVGGGALNIGLYLTASPAAAAVVVSAMKTS